MTTFEEYGRLAAECDVQDAMHRNQGYDRLAARYREEQIACLELAHEWRTRKGVGGEA